MIYKIYGNQLTAALVNDSKFIIFSFDGQYALVKSDVAPSNALEEYEESFMGELYNDPLYKQPCKDC
jgi:hypothetical protein